MVAKAAGASWLRYEVAIPVGAARGRREADLVEAAIEGAIVGDVARAKVLVGPGQIERIGFTVRYTF